MQRFASPVISFHCRNCAAPLHTAPAMSGRASACPVCDRPVCVPREPPYLRVSREVPDGRFGYDSPTPPVPVAGLEDVPLPWQDS